MQTSVPDPASTIVSTVASNPEPTVVPTATSNPAAIIESIIENSESPESPEVSEETEAVELCVPSLGSVASDCQHRQYTIG